MDSRIDATGQGRRTADARSDSDAVTAATRAEALAGRSAWDERRGREDEAIRRRREKALPTDARGRPVAGLALSGGGIRSATFCLGLIQGLARNGLLRRFDYLSSISGGGYIAAAVGRLIQLVGIDRAEAALAAGDSQVLGWLRKNGRYLTPSGSRDFGIAIATVFRSTVSTHFELALVALLVGVLVILPHAVQVEFQWFDASAWSGWLSVWWPLALAFWTLCVPGCILAFWPLRDPLLQAPWRRAERLFHILLAEALLVLCLVGAAPAAPEDFHIGALRPAHLGALAATGAILWQVYLIARLGPLRRETDADEVAYQVSELRSLLTRALRALTLVTAVLLLMGVFDRASFAVPALANALKVSGLSLSALLAAAGAAMLAVRSASEPLQKALASQPAMPLNQAANLAGLAVGTVLLFAWVCLLQWLVFFENALLHGISPLWSAVFVALAVGLWVLATYGNREAVNASTLHGFYRARLVRSYVSLGNAHRFADIAGSAVGTIESSAHSVVDYVRGDDVALAAYRPQEQGGPIHLIGTTLNQTVDDHGDLYNADRKGIAAVVNADGVEIGPAEAGDWPAGASASLGQWITISGAAAAPGAGSNTSRGFALLLFLFGVRLGYWVRSLMPTAMTQRAHTRHGSTRAANRLYDTKSGLILSEALASFFGRPGGWWYLSDGGHFENTGVYALLRREVPFILLADCGADPQFSFEDLENLIRKARIDFDAEIELYSSADAEAQFGPMGASLCVLAPDQMANNHTRRGVLLARIAYRVSDPARRHYGTLAIVKPNLHDALDRDVLAYASRHSTFPQQSTADQFFDEAQWESYRRLGYDFGSALTDAWLAPLPNWHVPAGPADDYSPLRQPAPHGEDKDAPDPVPFWRRESAAATLRTTFNLSVVTTLAGLVWSAYSAGQKALDEQAQRARERETALRQEAGRQETQFAEFLRRHCDLDALSRASFCQPEPADVVVQNADLGSDDAATLRSFVEAARSEKFRHRMTRAPGWIDEIWRVCGTTPAPTADCAVAADAPARLCENLCERYTPDAQPTGYWGKIDKRYDDSRRILSVLQARWTQWWNGAAAPAATDPGQLYGKVIEQHPEPSAAKEAFAVKEAYASKLANAATQEALLLYLQRQQRPAVVAMAEPVPELGPSLPMATPPRSPAPGIPVKAGAAPPAAATSALAVCAAGGAPMRLYIQVFDNVALQAATPMRAALAGSGYLAVPSIENVVQSAQRRGQPAPDAWTVPTLIVHQKDAVADQQCASAVAAALQAQFQLHPQIRNLPASLKAQRHVLELWLPPAQSGAPGPGGEPAA